MQLKLASLAFLLLLAACSGWDNAPYENSLVNEAKINDATQTGRILATLPAPAEQLPVVVYDFQDQTGQYKHNDNFTEYSSAVTKGALAVLVKSLLDTGDGQWFMVAERGDLQNLLKEREIITAMRNTYARPDGTKLPGLPPLIYGGMMLEGGIIFYDSNVLTGGAAAGYFGINASTQYRRDIISVYLRAVDINTGRVILSVNSSKTVFSYAVNANLTRYLSYDKLLEAEAGYTVNEPGQLAVRQAIEASVYGLVMEGALHNMWQFKDADAGRKAMMDYQALKIKSGGINTPLPLAPDTAKIVEPAKPHLKADRDDSWLNGLMQYW